jgi:hypothetical protein
MMSIANQYINISLNYIEMSRSTDKYETAWGGALLPLHLTPQIKRRRLRGEANAISEQGKKWTSLQEGNVSRLAKELSKDSLFVAIVDRIFSSVCPSGMLVKMIFGDYVIEATDNFLNFLNRVWRTELKEALRQLLMLGYFVVTYVKSNELYCDRVPHVLSPSKYTLKWSETVVGQREYILEHRGGKCSGQCDGTHPLGMSKDYDIFIDTSPDEEGYPVSKAVSALGHIVDYKFLLMNYKLCDVSRMSTGVAVETKMDKKEVKQPLPASEQSLEATDLAPEDILYVEVNEHEAANRLRDATDRQRLAEAQHSGQAQRRAQRQESGAANINVRHVDSRGIIEEFPYKSLWTLPEFVFPRGQHPTPIPQPRESAFIVEMLRHHISSVSSIFGVPPEMFIGNVSQRLMTSDIAHVEFRRTIDTYQDILATAMEKMYWKIYFESHFMKFLQCNMILWVWKELVQTGRFQMQEKIDVSHKDGIEQEELSQISEKKHKKRQSKELASLIPDDVLGDEKDKARQALRLMRIRFSFVKIPLDFENAQLLYHAGILNEVTLKEKAMEHFGLSAKNLETDIAQALQSRQVKPTAKDAQSKPTKGKKDKDKKENRMEAGEEKRTSSQIKKDIGKL